MEENKTTQQIMYEISRVYEKRDSTHDEIMELYKAVEDKNDLSADRDISYLHLAAQYADYEAVEYLLGEGVSPMAKNAYKQTPLHYLAECTHHRIRGREWEDIKKTAAVLLGARVSALMRDDGAGGNLCYHAAMKAHNLLFMYAMMDNKVKLDMLDMDGRNVLHLLVLYPAESARHSIQYTRQEEEIKKNEKILEECFELAEALIAYGIDPEAKDKSQKSAAEYAVEKGLSKLSILLKGEYDPSDATLADKIASGGMNLWQASERMDAAAVAALLRLGENPNEVFTEDRYSSFANKMPLGIACAKSSLDCVTALLEGGADPNFKGGEQERTAFYYFFNDISRVSNEQEKEKVINKIIDLLLNAGMDINGSVDEKGNTPINLSFTNSGQYKKIIRQALLDTGKCDYNLPDKNGVTPLMNLAKERFDPIENDLITLLEYGADMTYKDSNSNTVLMYAAMNSNHGNAKTMADLLFSFGNPMPEAVNNDGKTALDIAVEEKNEDLVKFLLERM